jgi:leucyl-tRNA synthetase
LPGTTIVFTTCFPASAAALGDERVQAALAGKQVVKTIVVPGKLVNLVVR